MATIAKVTKAAKEFFQSEDFQGLLKDNGGRFITTVHVKKDGSERSTTFNPLTAKYGSKTHEEFTNGGSLKYNPKERGLLLVADNAVIARIRNGETVDEDGRELKPWRMINLETLRSITIKGVRFQFEN